jgi:hypothetical protein
MCRRNRISRSLRAPEPGGERPVHAMPLWQHGEIAGWGLERGRKIRRRFPPEGRMPGQERVDLLVVLFGFE